MMITEGLAEIKVIKSRIATKQQFVLDYVCRPENLKDPLEKDGGSYKQIEETRQSIADLEKRIVAIRRGIDEANKSRELTLNGVTMSIADWITWAREVAPNRRQFLTRLRQTVTTSRDQTTRGQSRTARGLMTQMTDQREQKPTEYVVSLDESALAKEIEMLEDTIGSLDGQLSLINATTTIEIKDG